MPDTDLEITFEDETDYGKQNFYSVKESFFEDRSFPVTEEAYTWEELFEICNRHREVYNIPQDEQVFLLTDKKNEENWFGAADERTLNNFFVD